MPGSFPIPDQALAETPADVWRTSLPKADPRFRIGDGASAATNRSGYSTRGVDVAGGARPPAASRRCGHGNQSRTGQTMTNEQRQRAIRRIRAKRGFWVHSAIYLAVMASLFVIWLITSSTYPWPLWPMLGWGIGVIAHGAGVYLVGLRISETDIDRELQRGASTTNRR